MKQRESKIGYGKEWEMVFQLGYGKEWEMVFQLAKKECEEYEKQIRTSGDKLSERGKFDFRRGFERGYRKGKIK